MTYSPKI